MSMLGRAFTGTIFGLGAMVIALGSVLFWPWRRSPHCRRRARRFVRGAINLWFYLGRWSGALDVRISAETRALLNEPGAVVIANHPTLIDALVVLSAVPDGVCLFKRGLRRHPFFGAIAVVCGFLANDGGPDLVREAGRALAEGCNVVIFPEGTRSPPVGVGPFRTGFALIAQRYERPLIVLELIAVPRFLGKGSRGWQWPKCDGHFIHQIHHRRTFLPGDTQSAGELAHLAHDTLQVAS